MNTKTKRDRTGDLIEVKIDDTGKLANRIVQINTQISGLELEKESVCKKLIDALKDEGRLKISTGGFTLRVKEQSAVSKILVSKVRE